MAQLFSKGKIKQEVAVVAGLDIADKIAIVQKLHAEWKAGNADDETRYEQNFNQLFFNELLGYTRNEHMHPKASTPVGGKIADLGLGLFREGKYNFDDVQVVVELKGAKIFLDKKQNRQNPQSPVDQGFGYKTSFTKCKRLIVSNFHQVRLYRDNKQDYQEWTLQDLASGHDNWFALRSLLVLLSSNRLLSTGGESHTEKLMSQFRIEQQKITKKFYQEYKGLRLDLINDIRQHNSGINIEIVVEKAQKIIDRLVFVHFCEDKGLLPADKLKENIVRAREADFTPWEILKKYFKGVDSGSEKLGIPGGYNGELFKPDAVLDSLIVGDAICMKFIHFGDYDFDDELSVNILGHIFEQSISDLEQLKIDLLGTEIETDQLVENKKQSKRKKDGIFYTPEYIVDYIVQNSLMKYLSEKEDECLAKYKDEQKAYQAYQQILQNVKVLDPACGSGAFLVKVFDVLYAENERIGKLIGGLFDESDTYKNILTNNIYGVDLNPESVEITKLSLWLKSAQKGKKLNNLDKNIKCGNSLIDDPAVAGERAFDWEKEFPTIITKEKALLMIDNISKLGISNNDFKKEMEKFGLYVGYFPIDNLIPSNKSKLNTQISDGYQKHFIQIQFPIVGKKYSEVCLSNNYSPHYLKDGSPIPLSSNDQIVWTNHHISQYEDIKSRLGEMFGSNIINNNFQDYLILFNFIFGATIGLFQGYQTKPTYMSGYNIGDKSPFLRWFVTDDGDENGVFAPRYRKQIQKEFNILILFSSEIKENLSKYNIQQKILYTGGFDVIVGNPPYVSTKSTQFIGDEKKYYSNRFEVAEYQTDTYPLFVEQGLNLIKNKGILGYIMPNSWLNNLKFNKLRKFLLDTGVSEITLLSSNVFADATVDTVNVFVCKGGTQKEISITEYIDLNFIHKHFIEIKRLLANKNYIFDLNTNKLHAKIIDKIRTGSVLIADILNVSTGIKEYQVGKGKPRQTQSDKDDLIFNASYQKDNTFRKQLRGSDIDRYVINWKGGYVSYGEWLAEPRNPKFFVGNSILIRKIPGKNNLIVSYVLEDYVIDQSVYVGQLQNVDFDLCYLLCVLNAKLLGFYFRYSQGEFDTIFPQIKINHFKQLPIKKILLKDQQPFIDKADQMLVLHKEFYEKKSSALALLQAEYGIEKISRKLESFWELDFVDFVKSLGVKSLSLDKKEELIGWFGKKKEELASLKSTIDQTDRKIDGMVYELYGLSEEEIEVVEGR